MTKYLIDIKPYPQKVWLSTIIVGPFISFLYLLIRTIFLQPVVDWGVGFNVFIASCLIVVRGAILSIPSAILYVLLFITLIRKIKKTLFIKVIMFLFAIVIVFTTFYSLMGFTNEIIIIPISYSIALFIFSFFYKVYGEETYPIR